MSQPPVEKWDVAALATLLDHYLIAEEALDLARAAFLPVDIKAREALQDSGAHGYKAHDLFYESCPAWVAAHARYFDALELADNLCDRIIRMTCIWPPPPIRRQPGNYHYREPGKDGRPITDPVGWLRQRWGDPEYWPLSVGKHGVTPARASDGDNRPRGRPPGARDKNPRKRRGEHEPAETPDRVGLD